MEARDSLYLTDDAGETTFKYDEKLPSLPVPKLEQTVLKLLDTIKPIGCDNQFELTKKRAQEFLEDANVLELQRLLEDKAKTSRNWLEEWWLEFAYLRSRKPLIPYSNMAAPLPILQPFWPVLNSTSDQYETCRAERSALSIYFILSFWLMLRQEKMRPMIHKGVPWSMSQFRYLFNTCRLPYESKDAIKSHFRVSSEGRPVSVEMIVLHKGYVFALNPTLTGTSDPKTSQGHSEPEPKLLTPPILQLQLRYIEDWAKYRPYGPGVGALTTQDRDDWAEAYKYLSELSDKNRQILERIEKALAVFVLDDEEPENSNQIARSSMCGNPLNRWADKSLSSIAFKNGTFGANADHTPYDGFCTGIMTHYLLTSIKECNGTWTDDMQRQAGANEDQIRLATIASNMPELLDFKLDDKLSKMILRAKSSFEETCGTIDSLHCIFDHYGKDLVKQHRFHPEAFVQCAIHLTYYRLHKKAAPAYVTASTRRFYRGRTETCRSCYPEMIEFAQSMLNDKIDARKSYEMLKVSVLKFQKLMSDATNGQGSDRHLMGLYLTAMLEGREIPALFDDELVRQINNYILSTSCGGYWEVCGGVPPLADDGYGCFYSIEDHRMTFTCTAYKTCPTTDVHQFYSSLTRSLLDMQKILISNKL